MNHNRLFRLPTPIIIAVALVQLSCGSDSAETANVQVDLDQMAATLAAGEIQWLQFDEGYLTALEQNLPMLVDFTSSSCHWCRRMEVETFSMPSVIRTVNDKFIPVQVWGDSDEMLRINGNNVTERQLTLQSGVTGYPTFMVLTPSLERIHQFKGYRDSRGFVAELSKTFPTP